VNAASDTERGAELERDTEEFERQTRELLLASADQLSGATRSRLTQARFAAVAARPSRQHYQWRRWAPAGAAAVAVALLVVFVPHGARTPVSPVANSALEDMDLLSSDLPLNGDPDMDYDFYEWAVAQANSGAVPVSQDASRPPSTGA
jgi:hypothetical protein